MSALVLQGEMEQTAERKESIAQSPMAKLCESQMANKNNLLPACRNVTEMANNLDRYHLKITSNSVPESFKNWTYMDIYSVARHWLHPYVSENIYPQKPEQNAVDIIININERSTALNMTVETPMMNANFTNVILNQLTKSLLNMNPQLSTLDRLGSSALPLYYERKFIILHNSESHTRHIQY
jgi:hypothetical protein